MAAAERWSRRSRVLLTSMRASATNLVMVLIFTLFIAIVYSLFLVSIQMVTGPSLTSSTFMSAPNSPVPTCLPSASLMRVQK